MSRSSDGKGWSLARTCERCGRSPGQCRCREAVAKKNAPSGPAIFRLRIEKRRGKPVTVGAAEGVGDADLKSLLKELKGKLATGGTARDGQLELQGDHRDRLREELAARGYRVKG